MNLGSSFLFAFARVRRAAVCVLDDRDNRERFSDSRVRVANPEENC